MKEEEIDKLFSQKLSNAAPTPPADMWSRLQERMQEEMPAQEEPKIVQLQPEKEEKRHSFMWIYSSVAATLSLLLAVGVVFYNINTSPEVSQQLSSNGERVISETPLHIPQSAPETKEETQPEPEATAQNISEDQATEASNTSSEITEEVKRATTIGANAEQQKPAVMERAPKKATSVSLPIKGSAESIMAVHKPTDAAQVKVTEVKPITTASLASSSITTPAASNLTAEPVEIVIKRAVVSQAPQPVAEEPSELAKKTTLAKNIFKQMRNLSNGERVELSEIVHADKISVETQIGKQKLSKVINL
ncbi:hypothetical protein [Pontibacter harenae]|uniref:hypothetical protein n=1 Tax=Pontibacter harenae TaxID=2894083 RepID=UPI001E5A2803|nr:hypothetical protein [Pontibacter harenae]MCC9167053.1 hypothetical protein [Pontibacter harenae]